MTQNEEYLAVLKASYDYEPQSEDEIAIKENQILFLLDRVDDDWWKVKVKGDSQEDDSPSGLIPSAYVEQAEHTSIAKALYDYDAASPGELSIKEDESFMVFNREDEWVLVQSQKEGGRAGFVPGSYIEESGGVGSVPGPESQPEVEPEPEPEPESPPQTPHNVYSSPQPPTRPVSVYVDPADRVAQNPVRAQADHIKTWAVSEVDKKNKKKKGTLGIGNGSLFFASESDKTPVQKWDTADVEDFTIEKHKHILIDMGGANPVKLHFDVRKEEIAEAILTKLDDSRKLAISHTKATSEAANGDSNVHRTTLTPSPRPTDVGGPMKKNGVSVRFTEESPEIIPPREPSEEGEVEDQGVGELATALYDFESTGPDELSVQEGEQLYIIEKEGEEWWKCRNAQGIEGVVPASYLESLGPSPSDQSGADKARAREEREARERAENERERVEEERARAAVEAQKSLQEKERTAAAAVLAAATKKQPEKRSQQKIGGEQGGSSRSQPPQSSRASNERKSVPPADSTRTWHDRSGQFRVDAAFLGYSNGKLRLHKVNGVVIEVPSEKMSIEDMRYVERLMKKKSPPSVPSAPPQSPNDDDNLPLALKLPSENVKRETVAQQKKKGPQMDWFDFFLSAGCDLDDCTRYAHSFDKDKIDESLLPDITESTMRSLGLREGDIIRVNKVIQQKYAKIKLQDPQDSDEELAARLQEGENMKKPISPAPNLFSGPGGVLKNNTTRRGRPQPRKNTPSSMVDLDAIGTASEQIKRTGSPLVRTSSPSGVSAVQPPQRTSSAMATVSGFDDDAWTNRPGSKPPAAPAPPAPASEPPRAPSAPPAPQSAATSTPPAAPQESTTISPNSIAKATESDVFNQLARLSQLKTNRAVPSPAPAPSALVVPSSSPPVVVSPPPGYNGGLGMGSSPIPMGQHIQSQQSGTFPVLQQNGPRGPYAPVPANQGLLQPLIPTQTGCTTFVPTRPSNVSPFLPQPQIGQPSLLQSQPTGFPSSPQLFVSQSTGFPTSGPLLTQPTAMASGMLGGFGQTSSFPNTTAAPMQTNPTGFSPFGQSPFSNIVSTPSQAVSLSMTPSSNNSMSTNNSPANIFAQMKSGTFASGNEQTVPQSAEKYDALRVNSQPTGWVPQAATWGMQNHNNGFQNGYTGF